MSAIVNLDDVIIGPRVRQDMGDIAALAESIKAQGLLQPIVVTSDGKLIAGERRIHAARLLGMTSISAIQIDTDLLKAERDENTTRKDFTPTELARIGTLIEEQYRSDNASTRGARIAQGIKAAKQRTSVPIGSEVSSPKETKSSAQVAAEALGVSASTLARAKAVVRAAAEDPARYGDLPALMDATTTTRAHEELLRRQGRKPQSGHDRAAPTRHPLLKRTRRAQLNVDKAIDTLEVIAEEVFRKVDRDHFSEDNLTEWLRRVRICTRIITSAIRRLDNAKNQAG